MSEKSWNSDYVRLAGLLGFNHLYTQNVPRVLPAEYELQGDCPFKSSHGIILPLELRDLGNRTRVRFEGYRIVSCSRGV